MNLCRSIFLTIFCLFGMNGGALFAQDDPGKMSVGRVKVAVYYGTDADPAAAGERFPKVEDTVKKQLQKEQQLQFKHYRLLGLDDQPLFRSYENWAQPLKPSDEVLVRFESRSLPSKDSMRLDLELWLSRKKILKTDALLERDKPLFILGPEWRGGRLIISVALATDEKQAQ
ncbi:hypothetical protein JIN85_01695 [Luteolibacter pohnpeiensis]|uniref:Chalcone isomerase domain-containing protein n=1 Tax=Luteolibacter pohnpeiensis TaxID=454153 RepID=A0A934VPK4_9BACT|nr:hypothetical protein [Luteolibacter pohnpeiensis]MBK1881106.1 hypothetical protein [Luteolibacter pohnpeiensis]